jgi:UDP-2,3-diacylglucosamine pyrophosphatase LpxH
MTNILHHPFAVMISDLHVGSPENATLEDFRCDVEFERLLLEEVPEKAAGHPASLVIAGDFIDFPQICPEFGRESRWERLGTTEEQSLFRMRKAIEGHPRVFEALAKLLEKDNHVVLLPGNHDIDVHFESVRAALVTAMRPRPDAFFFATHVRERSHRCTWAGTACAGAARGRRRYRCCVWPHAQA